MTRTYCPQKRPRWRSPREPLRYASDNLQFQIRYSLLLNLLPFLSWMSELTVAYLLRYSTYARSRSERRTPRQPCG